MTMDRRIADRRRVTASMRISILFAQIFCWLGGMGVGIILMSSVLVSEKRFWQIVTDFWGWV